MTESKLYERNTHTDSFPINEQLIPYTKDKGVFPKEEVVIHKKASLEIAQQIMLTIMGLFTMIVLIYPVFILPGLVIVILPIEVVIADQVYGEFIEIRSAYNTHHLRVSLADTANDEIENDQPRILVYGRHTPA